MNRTALIMLSATVAATFSSCNLLQNTLSAPYKKGIVHAPFDVIIVPGVPFDSGKVNPIYKARIFWAKALFDNGIASNIIFSGGAVHSPYVEAEVMKITADSLGIPIQNIFTETEAMHTTENLSYSIAVAHLNGFSKIAVATDPIQGYYLNRFVKKNKMDIAVLPFSIDSMPDYYKKEIPRIDASTAFMKNFIPLEKREVALK